MFCFQVNEYYSLKGEATKRCGLMDMELNKLLQEHETDRNTLQFEQRRLVQASERVKNVSPSGFNVFWFCLLIFSYAERK